MSKANLPRAAMRPDLIRQLLRVSFHKPPLNAALKRRDIFKLSDGLACNSSAHIGRRLHPTRSGYSRPLPARVACLWKWRLGLIVSMVSRRRSASSPVVVPSRAM